jgi:hypothetical protein
MSNCVQLTSGGGFDFDKRELFGRYNMERDLAWPLAGINRMARHSAINWAVAIHSVAVARTLMRVTKSRELAAAGLLHDAHESIIGDIMTPVARAIDSVAVERLKDDVQLALEDKLAVPTDKRPALYPTTISIVDRAALIVEKQLFMAPAGHDWGVTEPEVMWTQTMWDVIVDILQEKEHLDGGYEAFIYEYHRLVEGA